MSEVVETPLPGVGVRYEYTTVDGTRVGVLCHNSGRRDVMVYDERDPDVAHSVLQLEDTDARTLTELLGGTLITEVLGAVQQRIEGLALEWLPLSEASSLAGRTIGASEIRTRTGISIVAVIRGESTEPAPEPDYELLAGDVIVAVGRPEAFPQLRELARE